MTNFQDLPTEIILDIINFSASISETGGGTASKNCLCNLRLASKQLNVLICPVLFATLRLDFEPSSCSRCCEIIGALANRSTNAFEYTKRLHISTRELYWTEEHQTRIRISDIKRFVVDKLYDAIINLKNLSIIEYMYSPQHDPEQLAIEVIRALGTLSSIQSFENLRIFSNPPSSFTLKSISNLTTFRVHWSWDSSNNCLPDIASLLARCPQLTEVYLRSENYSTDTRDTSLHDIFAEVGKSKTVLKLEKLELCGVIVNPDDFEAHVRHFGNLTFLGITNNPSSNAFTAFGATCNILRQHNDVYLKGVVTDLSGDPLLLSYLSSYSGLTKLCLGLQDSKEDFTVINRIYTQILPKHSKTLKHVELGSVRSQFWCQLPTKEQIAGLLDCQQLRVLKVRSIADAARLMQNDGTIFEAWFDIGLRFPNLALLHITPKNVFLFDRLWNDVKEMVAGRYRKERGMKFKVD